MFNSTGNNFGAGQISFKDYQAENYVVLNSKFSFDPTSPDYQACEQLEIYVPDLSIDRSAVGAVFLRFRWKTSITPGVIPFMMAVRAQVLGEGQEHHRH
jgi:hypothetical protein